MPKKIQKMTDEEAIKKLDILYGAFIKEVARIKKNTIDEINKLTQDAEQREIKKIRNSIG